MNYSEKQPLAIIGMGCRFPGNTTTPDEFWEMMCAGRDGVIEVPAERWSVQRFYDPNPEKTGKTYVKHGGYLQQSIKEMDALFFGISPREAETLDPQQRVMLEVAWEALEDAGVTASELAGSNTGVFIGGFMMDHLCMQTNPLNRHLLNAHSAISFTQTILSARLAYIFDLRGPCLTMDTACSSSLVALHQASRAIWHGDCDLALVGGVNIMYRVETFITMAKGQLVAKDGRSKSFDARGDGYGRGEGAGLIVIKPLVQAQQDGDLIYASIVATGINQDGHTDGITVPSPQAQTELMTSVMKEANITADDIAYIEAHGTGTSIGDPCECQALGDALGAPVNNPVRVGSVKANIGHLEAAAGIAGVIKAALCLDKQSVPPVANLQTLNPEIPFKQLGIRIPQQVETLSPSDDGRYVAINSFGYGGTNAHAVLVQAPERSTVSESGVTCDSGLYFLPLSARSEQALQDLAGLYAKFIGEHSHALQAICYSASTRREHHRYRLGLVASSVEEFQQQLSDFSVGRDQHLLSGKAPPLAKKAVFVMTGMGPQWWNMGQELFNNEPVFKAMAEKCDAVFKIISGWSILDEMQREEVDSRMAETCIAQPANFVLQVSLFELWCSKGFTPSAIVGHSVGEVSAAYVSGVLSLEDALRVSFERSRLQQTMAGRGRMLAVSLSPDAAEAYIQQYDKNIISFAAINSLSSVTLSGDTYALEEISQQLTERDIFNRFLRVEIAYHSPVMIELYGEIMENLKGIQPQLPSIPLYSTVTGQRVDRVLYDAEYWYQNIRRPVYFADTISEIINDGHQLFLEVGPHPVLGSSIHEMLNHNKQRGHVVASLKRKQPECETFCQALAELYCVGMSPDWQRFYPDGGQFIRLPLYPWQRQRYWLESEASILDRCGDSSDHAILGHRQNTPTPIWTQPLNVQYLPWLLDHKVQNLVVLPGAAYIELALQLQILHLKTSMCTLEDIRFLRALIIDDLNELTLQTDYDEKQQCFRIYSGRPDSQRWHLHAQGHLSTLLPCVPDPVRLDSLKNDCHEPLSVETLYARLSGRNLQYGDMFRTIKQAWRGENQILIQLQAHEMTELEGYALHPVLLDGAFQSLIGIINADDDSSFMPVAIGKLDFFQSPSSVFWAHSRLTYRDDKSIVADIHLFGEDGQIFVSVQQLQCQAVVNSSQQQNTDEWLYRIAWKAKDIVRGQADTAVQENPASARDWLIFLDNKGISESVIVKLEQANIERIIKVYPADAFREIDKDVYSVNPHSSSDMMRLMDVVGIDTLQGTLFAWTLDLDEQQDPDGSMMTMALLNCARSLVAASDGHQHNPNVNILSSGAQSVATSKLNTAQASVVGLARVITNEYPLQCTLIDIDEHITGENINLLAEEILADDEETEVAIYNGQRFVYRLQYWKPENGLTECVLTGKDCFTLKKTKEQVCWQQDEPGLLMDSEIRVHVQYAILPKGFVFGHSKKIIIVGQVIKSEHPGYPSPQSVIALVSTTGIGSYITVNVDSGFVLSLEESKQSLLKRVGKIFSGNQRTSENEVAYAGFLPDFGRALYTLKNIARLQSGQTVLIHASEDNSDIAAAQIALSKTPHVVVTCQNESKKEVLQTLGVQYILSLEDKDVLQKTATIYPEGFDVILNNLPGDIAVQSLKQAKPFARVVMNAAHENTLHVQCNNIQITYLDMDALIECQPRVYRDILKKILNGFAGGAWTPVPIDVYSAKEVGLALSLCREHSIALAIGASEEIPASPKSTNNVYFGEGSYLVTGAFGGFGLKLAEWLAQRGAKHLILVGRSGAVSYDAKNTLALLRDRGIEVFEARVDISESSQVEALMIQIRDTFPPLKGVFHTAAVLDDSMLNDLTTERLTAVMRPKALGAWHLHCHTKNLGLDHFVLFSSISSLVGKPGQGNYVAANAYLDQLAHYRQSLGLAAISLDWGVLAEVGMAARQGVEDQLMHMGIGSFSPDEAMQMLGKALSVSDAQMGLMHMNWQAFSQSNSSAGFVLRYEDLLNPEWLTGENSLQPFYDELNSYKGPDRVNHLVSLLIEWIAKIMRLPVDNIDTDVPLSQYGLDSLMAVEVQAMVEKQTGARLSMLEFMQDNSIDLLADKLLIRLEQHLD
ncbi:MAG: SDR family NAD(P)-dependent oxidoreductase [Gammaproteobacteria bacterium]|nr:SDR family NAD(P)-dependent oxidoreductase [Gammaproteobacteria bacterium]